MRILFAFIILGCFSCSNTTNDNMAEPSNILLSDSLKSNVRQEESKQSEITDPNVNCDKINSLPNKRQVIKFYYSKSYFKDSLYKYLPLCLDGEYSELFTGVYLEELKSKSHDFFNYFTSNNFTDNEIGIALNYFTSGIYDEISNQVEEDYSQHDQSFIKSKIVERINDLFSNKQLEKSNQNISERLKDSLMVYNQRY